MPVRDVRGYLQLNGTSLPVLELEAVQTATKQSGQFSAAVAIDGLPDGIEDMMATETQITGAVAVEIDGEMTVLQQGDIDTADFDLDTRVLTVSGRDASAKLHSQRSSEKFNNQTSSDIVSSVSQAAGVVVQADSTDMKAGRFFQIDWTKITNNTSLGSLIHKLAEFEGASWYVKDDTLHFSAGNNSGSGQPYLVSYYADGQNVVGNFLTLRVSRNIPLHKDNVTTTVSSWHAKSKKVYTGTQGAGKNTYKYHAPNHDQGHVDKLSKSKHADHTRHALTLSVEMVGDPSIDISQKLQLSGTKFDGLFDIDRINHKVAERGYTMNIEAKTAGDSSE